MRIATCERFPKLFVGDPETLILMLRLRYHPAATNAVYMAQANEILVSQGRAAIDTTDAQRFLEGLAAHEVITIDEP